MLFYEQINRAIQVCLLMISRQTIDYSWSKKTNVLAQNTPNVSSICTITHEVVEVRSIKIHFRSTEQMPPICAIKTISGVSSQTCASKAADSVITVGVDGASSIV